MNQKIKDAILRELKAAGDIADTAEAANRPLTGDEQAAVAKHLETATALRKSAKAGDDVKAQLAELGAVDEADDSKSDDTARRTTPAGLYVAKRGESLGKAFVDSPEYQSMLAGVPGGRFGEKSRVQSQPFGVKALITGVSDTSAGALVDPQQLGMLDPFYERPLTLRQLVTNGTTGTDTVEYVRLTGVTNNAAPVAEATSSAVIGDGTGGTATGVTGGVKPESAMAFARDSTTVKTIAHWIPATKRSLSDAGQVRTLIDAFLLYGLEEKLEGEIMSGDGTGEHLLGLANTSGMQTQAPPAGGQTVMDVLRIARRKVRIGGRTIPTAYALNPIDWESIELTKDANDRYYGAGPFAMTNPTLWGLPVVESEAVPQGTAYVGDWRQAVLWDREQASIQATDAHADFFIRNLVAILAEMRAAFAVLRPAAFVKVTLA